MPRQRNPRTVILEHLRNANRIMRNLTNRWNQHATIYDRDEVTTFDNGRTCQGGWRKRRPQEYVENQTHELVALIRAADAVIAQMNDVITVAQERYRELKAQQP